MIKSVQYDLDKERHIRLDMNAIERYETQTGKIFMEIDMAKIPTKDMAVLVWAGLSHEDPDITLQEVKTLIDEHSDVVKLYEIVIKAIIATIPEQTEVKQPKNTKRA